MGEIDSFETDRPASRPASWFAAGPTNRPVDRPVSMLGASSKESVCSRLIRLIFKGSHSKGLFSMLVFQGLGVDK